MSDSGLFLVIAERGASANRQLTFEYLTQADGPLARCAHGFPDSPFSYRYVLPALADAGDRAAAPLNRGFAPTELPDDRHNVHTRSMVADQIALHEALGGDDQAILIAHDWGAAGARGAVGKEPAGGAAASSSTFRPSRSSARTSSRWIVRRMPSGRGPPSAQPKPRRARAGSAIFCGGHRPGSGTS